MNCATVRLATMLIICALATILVSADDDRDTTLRKLEEYYGEVSIRTIPLTLNPRRPDHLPIFLSTGISANARIEWAYGEKTYEGTLLVYTLSFSCDDEETADLVRILLDGGADPNERDPMTDEVPLARVVACPRIVKMLLDAGADPNARTKDGYTPLRRAMGNRGKTESVRLLIEAGADVHQDRKRLEYSAGKSEDPEKRRLLEEALTKPPPRKLEPWEFEIAIGERNMKTVREYLKQNPGAGPAGSDEEPRFISLANRCTDSEPLEPVLEIFNTLLEAGARVNGVASTMSNTPLHVAAQLCQAEIVKALIDAGAAVGAKDTAGHTPLFNAVMAGSVGATEVLLDAGAKADRQTKFFANNKPEIKKLLKKKR